MVLTVPRAHDTTLPTRESMSAREITRAEHESFLRRHPDASFMQNPYWGDVKTEWVPKSVGLVHTNGSREVLVGAALMLFRHIPVPIPMLKKYCLAYIADGPVMDDDVLVQDAMYHYVQYARSQNAFQLRVGLHGVLRRWDANDVRKATKDDTVDNLLMLDGEINMDEVKKQDAMVSMGFTAPVIDMDFGTGQPMFQARIPLQNTGDVDADVGSALKRMNQTCRSETRKSTRTGLKIRNSNSVLSDFHLMYKETADREHFNPRQFPYFERILDVMRNSSVEIDVLTASNGDNPLAGALLFRQGEMAWYPYGGSTTADRKMFAPRALQLEMIRLAVSSGCKWYDMGGVAGSLKSDHKTAGLTLFKTAMGADIVQTHGEYTMNLNKPLAKAFDLYMSRR